MRVKLALVVIMVFLVLYFIFLIREDCIRWAESEHRLQNIVSVLKKETAKTAILESCLSKLEQAAVVETLARIKLGFVKNGEVLYKVVKRGAQ